MRKQSGIALYAAVAALVVFGGMAMVIKWQHGRYDDLRKEYDGFVDRTALLGVQAEAEAARVNTENAKRKAKYDKEISNLRAANADLNRRLLDSAAESSLPRPREDAPNPDRICFDRAKLDDAIRRFTAGAAGIAAAGGDCVTALDNARRWAQDR